MNIYFELLQAVVALFIIIDPLGNLPIFIGLTEGLTQKERKDTFVEALYVGFLLLLLFTLAGTGILTLFRISLDDFKIAGGLLLLAISISMLVRGHFVEITDKRDIGAVPLGIPLMVGPGAITTAMVLIGLYGVKLTLAAVIINFIISGIIFYWSDVIYEKLGHTGSMIIAKVMAIIIAAIAVKFIREGIVSLFHFYA
jgi:multiple antibiotic resistance protein